MEKFLTEDIVSISDICSTSFFYFFSEIVMVMINWQQDLVSSNSVCMHICD